MKSILFFIIPLIVYTVINNAVDDLFWPYFLVLLIAFVIFQLARLRYPKDAVPLPAKITQAAFYVLTVAFIFRDQFLSPLIINVLLGLTIGLVIAEILQSKKQPSA